MLVGAPLWQSGCSTVGSSRENEGFGVRGSGLAPICTPSPVVAHPGGHPAPTVCSSTESREQPSQAWRNEDLVFQDEDWKEEGCSASMF